jgi:hypothetical protein
VIYVLYGEFDELLQVKSSGAYSSTVRIAIDPFL